jgi:hypothetical protein
MWLSLDVWHSKRAVSRLIASLVRGIAPLLLAAESMVTLSCAPHFGDASTFGWLCRSVRNGMVNRMRCTNHNSNVDHIDNTTNSGNTITTNRNSTTDTPKQIGGNSINAQTAVGAISDLNFPACVV